MSDQINEQQSVAQPVNDSNFSDQSVDVDNEAIANSTDDWGDSEDAFYEGGDLEEFGSSKIGLDDGFDEDNTSDKDSHLEVDDHNKQEETETENQNVKKDPNVLDLSVDLLGLDKSNIPHKYRPLINEKVNGLISEANKQFSEKVSDYQESNKTLASAFVDIINSENPSEALYSYAKEAVPALGLDPKILTNLEGKVGGGADKNTNQVDSKPFDAAALNARVQEQINKVRSKYDSEIFKTEDPQEFMRLMDQRNSEIHAINEAVNNAKLRAVIESYHSKLVQPHLNKVQDVISNTEKQKEEAIINQQVSLWNNADQELSSEFKDWGKYRGQVKELIKTKYNSQKVHANTTGQGHKDLMRDLYYVVSRNDHLNQTVKPQRGNPGLRTTTKHIKTQKAGGSDWDSIMEEDWGDIIPQYD